MPKKYGVKEKDLVVSHVVNLVLTGKLRSGDRLDRNEIAEQLSPLVEIKNRGLRTNRANLLPDRAEPLGRHPCDMAIGWRNRD